MSGASSCGRVGGRRGVETGNREGENQRQVASGTSHEGLPYQVPTTHTLSWVATACWGSGAVCQSCVPLGGGTNDNVDLVIVQDRAGRSHQVVLRRWAGAGPDRLSRVEREVNALEALCRREIPAPRLLAYDATGSDAGVACLVMTRMRGSVVLQPSTPTIWAGRLAELQAEIHRLPPTLAARTPGWFEMADLAAEYDWISDTGLRRAAVAAARETGLEDAFVHGDYQQFNVLWRRGEVSGVLDWTMTGIGASGIDVGHTRLNLAALYSSELANFYLRAYERAAETVVDPRAELRSFLCWSPRWTEFSIPATYVSELRVDQNQMQDRVSAMVHSALQRLK